MDRALYAEIVSRKRAGPGLGLAMPLAGEQLGYTDPAALVEAVDERAMRVKAVISTIDRDRSGDVVLPQGCLRTLDNYRRNPVVLLGHQELHPLPIGRSEDNAGLPGVDVEADRRVTAWCRFSQATQDACDVFALVVEGTLRQASIGFVPHVATRLAQTPHGKALPGGQTRDGYYVEDWELIEWSWVVVADNASCEAIRAHLSRGRITGKTLSPVLTKALTGYAAPLKVWSNGMAMEPEAVAVETKGMTDQQQEPVGGEQSQPQPEPQEPQMPHTAATAKEVIDHLKALLSYLDEIKPILEPKSDITAHLENELRPAVNKVIAGLHAVASDEHPDHDFGRAPQVEEDEPELEDTLGDEDESEEDSDDVEDAGADNDPDFGGDTDEDSDADDLGGIEDYDEAADEDETDDEEDPEAKYRKSHAAPVTKGGRYMNAGCKTVLKEAADYLDEVSDHEEMHKQFKYGHKYHAGALRKALGDEMIAGTAADGGAAVPDEDAPMGDVERKQLQAAIQTLSRRLYLITGKRVTA